MQPYFSHNFEVVLGFLNAFYVTTGYSLGTDVVAELTVQDDATKIVYTTQGNIATQKNFYTGLNTEKQLFKWWNISGAFNVKYISFYGPYADYQINNQMWYWSANMYNTFLLGANWKAVLGGFMTSPHSEGINEFGSIGALSMTFEKKIKAFTIQFGISDILNTQYERVTTIVGNQNEYTLQRHDTRRGWIRLRYNFNNNKWLKKKNIDKKDAFDDDKSRI